MKSHGSGVVADVSSGGDPTDDQVLPVKIVESLPQGTNEIGWVRTRTLTSQIEAITAAIGGPKDVTLFLTFSDSETGEIYRDLFRHNVAFAATAAGRILRSKGGPLGNYLAFPGSQTPPASDAYLTECPFATVPGAANPGHYMKYATRFTAANLIDKVALPLFKVGTPNSAKVSVSVYKDVGGLPGTLVTNPQVFRGHVVPVNALSGSMLSTSVAYAGFAFNPILPTSRGTDYYWLVLEYADANGVDGSNYIAWGYTTGATDGARAIWDGATWAVSYGESFGYRLYDSELRFGDDWSMIFLYNNVLNVATGSIPLFRQPGLVFHLANGRWEFSFTDDNGSLYSTGIYTDVSPGWRALGITFAREKSQNKIMFYADGKPVPYLYPINGPTMHFRAGLHGWAGHSLQKLAQPWTFGHEVQASGYSPGPSFNGYLGPILITKNVLTPEQMSRITDLMLYGNKEAV